MFPTVISPLTSRPRLAPPRAFSLIEVTIALGIAAFAFTAMLGMLPVGLSLFRDATETSVATRIVQRISGELQQADFDSLDASAQTIRYFDDQGSALPSSEGAIYWTKVSIFAGAELPGTDRQPSEDLSRIIIQVAHNPSGAETSAGADGTWQEREGMRIIKRSLFVARNTPKR